MNRLLKRYRALEYKSKMILTCILVGLIPLVLLGILCYALTVRILFEREQEALTTSVSSACHSLEDQLKLYENLITYLSLSETIVDLPHRAYQGEIEKFECFTYDYDVTLGSLYFQYPQISQITVYADRADLSHGRQLRPLSDLETQAWYDELRSAKKPVWYMDSDGKLCLFQKIADPFVKYIDSYSEHCICLRFDPVDYFSALRGISTDYRVQILDGSQLLYRYTSPSIEEQSDSVKVWTVRTGGPLSNGWTVTIEKPDSLLAAPANQMAFLIFLALVLCVALILWVSSQLSGYFSQKVRILLNAMHQVESGDFSVRINDPTPDEMGELTNSFQHMTDKLSQLVTQNYLNQIALKETQLLALQAQINPHFLYNCLSLINSKALLNRQPEISQMAQLLSTFYRTTLNKGKSETLLENEIKNVRSYVEIQLLLNDNAFDAAWQIDPRLPRMEIPNLLLQPLVENAIVHGILPNRARRGKLALSVALADGRIHFTVLDNGLGIAADKIPALTSTQSGGYGLKNVQERLLLTYGPQSGLKINSIEGQSTMIMFSIPVPPPKAPDTPPCQCASS